MRHGWGRVPSLPRGRRCRHGHGALPDRRLPPLNGRSLSPRCHDPSRDVFNNGASARVHWHSPFPAFPSPVAPGRNRDPRAFPWAPHPAGQDPAAHARAGTSLGTARSHVVSITDLLRRAHSPRAASCRTKPLKFASASSLSECANVTVASSRMQVTPSSVRSASRTPGSAPCRAATCAHACRRGRIHRRRDPPVRPRPRRGRSPPASATPSAPTPPARTAPADRASPGNRRSPGRRPRSRTPDRPVTRPRSCTRNRGVASARDRPPVRPVLSARCRSSTSPACDTTP